MASEYLFIFDLDSVITKQEILPTIAKSIGKGAQMNALTEQCMNGNLPFAHGFLKRVSMLQDIPVSTVQSIISNIALQEQILAFIQAHRERCYIVTGNLNVWIHPLMEQIGMQNRYFSSIAFCKEDRLGQISSVMDKQEVLKQFRQPFVAVGDGSNDAEMLHLAEIGIGYGAVRHIASSALACADYAFHEEEKLCQFLKQLL